MDQKTMTSKNVPGAKVSPLEQGLVVSDDQIKAIPLSAPGWQNVKWKNPVISGRWVNYVAQKGQRFEEAVGQGYLVVKDTDAEVPGVPFKDGAFRKGDLILMKMDRARYIGAIKYNEELSLRLAGVRRKSDQRRPATRDPRTGEAILHGKRGKLTFFEPGGKDLDLLENSESPDEPQARSDMLTETVKILTGGK
jgi:hypothetical protein